MTTPTSSKTKPADAARLNELMGKIEQDGLGISKEDAARMLEEKRKKATAGSQQEGSGGDVQSFGPRVRSRRCRYFVSS